MSGMYILAGVFHFIKPKVYMRIMPRYIPYHKTMVYLSGIAEIILGIGLCLATTKNTSIYGIICMLATFLLVHFYMLSSKNAAAGIPKWALILRLPLQFGLMYWAYSYLRI